MDIAGSSFVAQTGCAKAYSATSSAAVMPAQTNIGHGFGDALFFDAKSLAYRELQITFAF